MMEVGREHLLAEEDFVLEPGYIFATLPHMTLEFCYVPGYGVPLRNQLESLFEYLLNRVDYEDKQAVNLVYDCYMFCMREKGGLAEIKKLLEKNTDPDRAEPVAMVEIQPEPKPQEIHAGAEETGKKQPPSYVSWLAEKLFPWKNRTPALVAEEEEPYTAVSSPAVSSDLSDRTVLLSSAQKPVGPELICEQTGEVVPLIKFPFYIGSAKEFADFSPAAEGVSRIHCCISKKESNYYLSDLNSTNGTYLNGKEIKVGSIIN
jgi:hypothetical protein